MFEFFNFFYLVPDGPPLNCSVINNNSSSFVVSIGEPERLKQNGIIHYEAEIDNEYNQAIMRRINVDGVVTHSVFANLSKFTEHSIRIYAATRLGRGPPCEISIKTSGFQVNKAQTKIVNSRIDDEIWGI